jgi:hypothetical protein
MQRSSVLALVFAVALAGCSSSNGVSTASVLGNAPTPPPAGTTQDGAVAAVPMVPASTLTDRALQVGSVSARAAKCGYNFDAEKLKAAYLSSEIGRGSDASQAEKIYNVSYSGVMKAAAEDPNFCSERKTQKIKTDLNRLLAGDFEPPAKAVAVAKKDDGGLFSGWFDGSSADSGPSWGSGDWWDQQAAKTGK